MREKTLIKNEEDVSTVRSVTNWTDKAKTSRGNVQYCTVRMRMNNRNV